MRACNGAYVYSCYILLRAENLVKDKFRGRSCKPFDRNELAQEWKHNIHYIAWSLSLVLELKRPFGLEIWDSCARVACFVAVAVVVAASAAAATTVDVDLVRCDRGRDCTATLTMTVRW